MSNPSVKNSSGSLAVAIPGAVYAILFLALVLPVAVGWRGSEASFDEGRCYIPAIAQLRANFPAVDLLKDSLSASPPGYSQLLAGLSLATGDSLRALRAWHALLSLAGALLFLWLTVRMTGLRATAVAAVLPMLCSGYYLKSSAQLTTDNPALLLSFSALLFVFFGQLRPRTAAFAGVVGLAAIWVRHSSVWLAASMILKGLLAFFLGVRRTGVAWLFAALTMLCLLAGLVLAWGGLVPPRWSGVSGSVSFSSTVYSFALCGMFGPLFLFASCGSRISGSEWSAFSAGTIVGIAAFFLSEMTPSYEAGRFGGLLWALAGKIPVVSLQAFLFFPLSAAGAGVLALAIWRLFEKSPEFALLWAGSIGAWLISNVVNRQIFHRYYEGPVLGFWGLWILLFVIAEGSRSDDTRHGVLYLLAALLFASGAYSMIFSVTGFAEPLSQLPSQ